MRHQDKIRIQRRRRRKLFWLFAAAAVSALLLEEQVAVLYVTSALAICGLMLVLAFSNLQATDAQMQTAAAIREGDLMFATRMRDTDVKRVLRTMEIGTEVP